MLNDGLLTAAPRIALALIFIFGAINGFHYVVTGEDMIVFPASQEARAFTDALKASGFFWPFMKGLDFIGGFAARHARDEVGEIDAERQFRHGQLANQSGRAVSVRRAAAACR